MSRFTPSFLNFSKLQLEVSTNRSQLPYWVPTSIALLCLSSVIFLPMDFSLKNLDSTFNEQAPRSLQLRQDKSAWAFVSSQEEHIESLETWGKTNKAQVFSALDLFPELGKSSDTLSIWQKSVCSVNSPLQVLGSQLPYGTIFKSFFKKILL